MMLSPIHNNYIVNPNSKIVEAIKKGLLRNNGYCPCQTEQSIDTICPCTKYKINKDCCCSLYISEQ